MLSAARSDDPEQIERDYGYGHDPEQRAQGGIELQPHAQPEIEYDDRKHKQQYVSGESGSSGGHVKAWAGC